MSDSNIIEELKKEKNSAYDLIYQENYPFVEGYVLRNSGSIEDAQDIFQDTMLVLVQKLRMDNFQITASLKTYTIAISKNLWFKKLRYKSSHKEVELTDLLSDKFYDEIELSIEKEKTYKEKLQTYLSKITSHCNRLLNSIFFKNKDIEEVQEEFGYSTKHNAQNQKYKCIEQIKKVKKKEEDS